ncbi:DinB family protein [Nocardia uniformis]|uniref:DinB family protein n=1 Tax=Nocardia uniformis TaxID=53432 RepID=A0A849CGA2_9NOCA|nr:DinB family protein [Nocardia uniformis]NNH75885.1 DinB family protein [Nocardia uniformis]
MPIVPDTKDWTWVLERSCADCGFDPDATAYDAVPGLLRDSATRFAAVLERPDIDARPDEFTWSALEYAAHVRDVCRIMTHRLDITLTASAVPGPSIAGYDTTVTVADGIPMFANWDQDITATAENYAAQPAATVTTELTEAAETAARAFESVPPAARSRAARRSNGSQFTVDTLARYFVHDVVHHVHDVRG